MFATSEANASQKEIETELCGNKKLDIEGDPKKREVLALPMHVQTYVWIFWLVQIYAFQLYLSDTSVRHFYVV